MVSTDKLKQASATNARRVAARLKSRRILGLRKRGLSYREIAARVGMSHAGVGASIRKSLAELKAANIELTESAVELELARLDDVIRTMRRAIDRLSKATVDNDGKPKTKHDQLHKPCGVLLRAIEQRAKLLGLYAPVKIDMTTHEDALTELE